MAKKKQTPPLVLSTAVCGLELDYRTGLLLDRAAAESGTAEKRQRRRGLAVEEEEISFLTKLPTDR